MSTNSNRAKEKPGSEKKAIERKAVAVEKIVIAKTSTISSKAKKAVTEVKIKATTSQKRTTERAVTDLIETFRQGFLQLDPKLLWSIWDRGHVPLIYVAMEKTEPIHGWAAIERYIAALPDHLEEMVSKKIDNVRIDALGEAAVAFFQFHSEVRLKGREGIYRPNGRVTMLFRYAKDRWRVIHYHESALSAQAADAIAARAAG